MLMTNYTIISEYAKAKRNKYLKEKYYMYQIRVNKEKFQSVCNKLQSVDSINQYIIDLIEKDIKNENSVRK